VEIAQPMPAPVLPAAIQGNMVFHIPERLHPPAEDSVAAISREADESPAREDTVPVKADASPADPSEVPSQTVVDVRPFAQSEIVDLLKSQGRADIVQKGDRITTLEISSAAFFDSGSAALSKAGESILMDVTTDLKSDRLKDYQITVEELSTARASAVVHFFLDEGIPARKLRAAGYADTFPKAPNRDANGNAIPENQTQNRRVVIKMEKIDKAENDVAAKLDAVP
jgi:outer membrane protein OmpA-like peptidoglycan-associated protein